MSSWTSARNRPTYIKGKLVETHTHTHRADCSTWATKVVGIITVSVVVGSELGNFSYETITEAVLAAVQLACSVVSLMATDASTRQARVRLWRPIGWHRKRSTSVDCSIIVSWSAGCSRRSRGKLQTATTSQRLETSPATSDGGSTSSHPLHLVYDVNTALPRLLKIFIHRRNNGIEKNTEMQTN